MTMYSNTPCTLQAGWADLYIKVMAMVAIATRIETCESLQPTLGNRMQKPSSSPELEMPTVKLEAKPPFSLYLGESR